MQKYKHIIECVLFSWTNRIFSSYLNSVTEKSTSLEIHYPIGIAFWLFKPRLCILKIGIIIFLKMYYLNTSGTIPPLEYLCKQNQMWGMNISIDFRWRHKHQ